MRVTVPCGLTLSAPAAMVLADLAWKEHDHALRRGDAQWAADIRAFHAALRKELGDFAPQPIGRANTKEAA